VSVVCNQCLNTGKRRKKIFTGSLLKASDGAKIETPKALRGESVRLHSGIGVLGERRKLLSGVWSGAPTEIKFRVF